jgi:hypothetical protein
MSHKNDPDYHDLRAKTLLEAANHIKLYTKENFGLDRKTSGLMEATAELRRMASSARRMHKKVLDRKRRESRDSEAKAEAFGFGRGA